MLNRISQFFADRAMLSLVTLLVFTGLLLALAPIAWTYAQMTRSSRAPVDAGGRGVGNSEAAVFPCSRVIVSFRSSASMNDVAGLLSTLNASVAYGPDENSAFDIAVPAGQARAVAATLSRAETLVMAATPGAACP